MEKIRRNLLIFLACITIILSIITIHDKYNQTNYYSTEVEQLKAQWGLSLEPQARSQSKLIFFKVNDGSPLNASKEALDTLKSDYLMTNLTRLEFPADYAILNYIIDYKRTSKTKVKAGILCPDLRPVYLTVSQTKLINETAPVLSEAIILANKHFKEDPKLVRSIAKNSDMLTDAPRISKYPPASGLSFLNNEASNLLLFFNLQNIRNRKPAVISENARLVNKISQKLPTNLVALSAKEAAANCLYSLMLDKSLPFEDKLLYARALCEFENTNNYESIAYQLKLFAKKMLSMKNADGYVAELNSPATVRNNALCVSILLQIFEITKEDLYKQYAISIAENLLEHFKNNNGNLKAFLSEQVTQASSLEYVLTAKAFYDVSMYNDTRDWINQIKQLLRYWDKHFMVEHNLWAVNSDKSTFAKYIRPIITRDAEHPSYIGEASQLFSVLKIADTKTFDRLRRLSFNATSTVYAQNKNWASLKLATFNYY